MDTGMLVQVYVGDYGYQNCLLLMGGSIRCFALNGEWNLIGRADVGTNVTGSGTVFFNLSIKRYESNAGRCTQTRRHFLFNPLHLSRLEMWEKQEQDAEFL